MTLPAPRRAGLRADALPALALVALLAGGCAGEADVLARVQQQTITVAQFNEVALGNLQQLSGPPDSAKARLLRDLVDRELLVQGALAAGLDRTPEFAAFRRSFTERLLREELYQRLLGGPYPVSDAEVVELYARRDEATRARLIYSDDEAQIRAAGKDLARGEDFAAVADRYNPSGQIPPGGDVGFLVPGSLLAPLDDLVRTGEPGRVYGPVAAANDGWFIVRIEERRPETQPPLEEIRGQLAEMLRQRKQRLAMMRVVEQLRRQYRVTVLPGAAQLLAGRLRPVPGAGVVPATPPPPTAEERAQVLARHGEGAYTLGEAYDDLIGGDSGPIDFAMLPTVERWIRSQAIERAALAEARRRHIADEPAVQRRLRERLNNYLLDNYYQAEVIGRIRIGPADYRAAYERFRGSMSRLRSARVMSVTLADSAVAATLAAVAVRAPSLREAAVTAATSARVVEETVEFPASSPLWTRFESQLSMMRPGEIVGPYREDDGWLVVQLREKREETPTFESLPPSTLAQLQGVATELRREERLAALTDSLRRALTPVVYEPRLRRLRWPPAATAPPGS